MLRILIVEDSPFISEILRRFLPEYACECVGTFAGAVAALDRGPAPDVALVDVGLPDGSGLDLLRIIRGRSPLPVIILTAGGSDEKGDYEEQAKALGAPVLIKPIDRARLRALVQSLTGQPAS